MIHILQPILTQKRIKGIFVCLFSFVCLFIFWLKQQTFHIVLETGKYKIKALLDSVSGESPDPVYGQTSLLSSPIAEGI